MAQQAKRALYLLMAVVILSGCEKFFPKKPEKPSAQNAQAPEAKGTVIAKVNNQPITLEGLNRELEGINSNISDERPEDKIDTPEEKIKYLKLTVLDEALLAQAAQDRGLDRKEEVQLDMANFKRKVLVQALVNAETENIEIPPTEVDKFYQENKFLPFLQKEPEKRRIREIVVATESEAKEMLIELLRGVDFATLAQTRSIAPSKDKGGDLGHLILNNDLVKKYESFSTFIEMAFSPNLEVGRTSSYFKGPDGNYYIIKLEEKQEGKLRDVNEAWDDIKGVLMMRARAEKITKLVEKLHYDAKIETFDSAVK